MRARYGAFNFERCEDGRIECLCHRDRKRERERERGREKKDGHW